jgi:predicted metal-dependent enzyme (double-stranded beta helix superfamily)
VTTKEPDVNLKSGVLFTTLMLTLSLSSGAQVPQSAPGAKPLVDATHRRMQLQDALEGDRVLIFGDPSKPGFYVYRNRFRPGVMTRPHFHDQDRWVTVIKGTWWTDEGDVFRPDKAVAIKAGGFMFHPKGLHHYDGAKDEEAIVQIMGMGPVETTQTEVDAAGRPVSGR